MLASYFCGFVLHILSWFSLSLSLSLFWAGFSFMRGVCLTHPVLAFWGVGWGGGVLHILRWLYFSVGSFSYTSHAGFLKKKFFFFLIWGVSLTHPVMALILSGDFYSSHAVFIFIGGVSLTHRVMVLLLSGEFV